MGKTISAIFFFDLCRLCLDLNGTVDVLAEENLNQNIFQMTTVKISAKDQLPRKICRKCLEVVQSAAKLKILALKNDSNLRSIFGDETHDEETNQLNLLTEHTTNNFDDKKLNKCRVYTNKRKSGKIKHKDTEKEKSPSSPIKISSISVRKDLFQNSKDDMCETTKTDNISISQINNSENVTPAETNRSITISQSETNEPEKNSQSETIESENISKSKGNTSEIISQSKTNGLVKKRRKSSMEDNVEYHVCLECSKKFDTWKKFYHHQRSHIKKYLCPIEACEKKFSTKGDLLKHKRTHTGEKPYQCDICQKCFAQNVTLKSHKESVHCLLGMI